jgi:hypothetical protein
MTKFGIIGAVALSLVLAGPAMAAASSVSGMQRVHHKHYGNAGHTMPGQRMSAQDFDHFDLGIARPTYPSGWGGPYHDGEYPGTVDQNMGQTRR